MKNYKSFITTILLLLCSLAPVNGIDMIPLIMDIRILDLEEAGPPMVMGNKLIFTYKDESYKNETHIDEYWVKMVGARFEHEDYRILHTYYRNEHNIFILPYPFPDNLVKIKYRIVVDGLWMSDPFNPEQEKDLLGTVFSVVKIDPSIPTTLKNPWINPDGSVTLMYRSLSATRVTLTGVFNNWDPFSHNLMQEKPGLFTITLMLLPGPHYYLFVVDGNKTLDPFNMDSATDYEDYRVSTFTLP
jgi:hypothetical protein